MMNNVILTGRFTKDPEVKVNGENKSINTQIAVTRNFKNKDGNYDTDFINVSFFRQQAEFVEKFFHKGDGIEIVGQLRTGSYKKDDGTTVYTWSVVATNVSFPPGAKKSDGSAEAPAGETQAQAADGPAAMGFADISNVDDPTLPFNMM